MVVFNFLPKHFRRWQQPMNAILSLCDFRVTGRDTQTLSALIEKM